MVSMNAITEMSEYTTNVFSSLPKDIEQHCRRVGLYSKIFAGNLQSELRKAYPGISAQETLRAIQLGGFYHDIGKIICAPYILEKEKALSNAENEALKQHTLRAAEIVLESKLIAEENKAFQQVVLECCICHHERYDGGGYPKKLKARAVPIAAQVVSVCNVFDLLMMQGSAGNQNDFKESVKAIASGSGRQFAPKIVQYFKESHKELGTAFYYMKSKGLISPGIVGATKEASEPATTKP